jgi:hypothetical protein
MNKTLVLLLQAILPTVVQFLSNLLQKLADDDCPPPKPKLGRPPKSKPAPPTPPAGPLIK